MTKMKDDGMEIENRSDEGTGHPIEEEVSRKSNAIVSLGGV